MSSSRLAAHSAEKALIARLLIEPEQAEKVATLSLSKEQFALSDMSDIFVSIMRRFSEGKSFDVISVGEDTRSEIDVLDLSPAAFGPVEEYVNAIKDASLRRSLTQRLDMARARLTTDASDPVGIVSGLLEGIASERPSDGLRGASEVVRSYSEEFRGRGPDGPSGGVSFGVPGLDKFLLPMRAGRLVVFASRPGVGKTALAETVSDWAARSGPVLFVSLEMGAEELTDRAMARASGFKAGDIMRGKVTLESLDSHLKARADLPITYLDEGMTTTTDILAAAHKVKMLNDGKLGLIIVDYLQLVADKGEHEVYRVGGIAHALKRMALKLRVPVLSLVQLNRSIEYSPRAPKLSDLRDSGAIEQDADVVVVITGEPSDPERQLFILKQRQGHVGRLSLFFDGDSQRWSEPVAPERGVF